MCKSPKAMNSIFNSGIFILYDELMTYEFKNNDPIYTD